MKSIIFIVIGLIILSVLLGIASKNFDNATDELPSISYNEITEETEGENDNPEESSSDESDTKQEEKNFDFTAINDQGIDINFKDSIGKPTVIYFWASWCEYSRYELLVIEESYQKYKDSVNFMVVAIIDGEYETLDSAKEYLSEQSYMFPVYFDVYSEAFHNFELYGFPYVARTYLFYADGTYARRSNASTLLYSEMLESGIEIILN